jgi:hypothetical protein
VIVDVNTKEMATPIPMAFSVLTFLSFFCRYGGLSFTNTKLMNDAVIKNKNSDAVIVEESMVI